MGISKLYSVGLLSGKFVNQSIVYYARRQQNKNTYKIYSKSYNNKNSTHN